MKKKNITVQPPKQGKKIALTKKEVKKSKTNLKKGKKQEVKNSQIDEDKQQIDSDEAQSLKNEEQSDENEEKQIDEENDDQSSGEQQSSDQESSEQSLAPQNLAVKQMSFRERRGTKMNYLMNRKKEQQEDPFWQNQGQNFFGDLQDQQADQDYQQSSSGRDQFDSDFGQTQSEHGPQQQKAQEPQVDQDKLKQRKKQQELMRMIGATAPKKIAPKTSASAKKSQTEKKPAPQVTNRYIHQVCTQQQLLGQAAQTEYINWLSLQKLISLQNEKKDFVHKQHFLEGEKVIFRDKINPEGIRATTYELVGLNINKIADLTEAWNRQGEPSE